MVFKLSFSSCPNDTFIFDALINSKIDTLGHSFEIHIADIEELNTAAFNNIPDITKLSFGAYPQLAKNYQLLDSGSALGKGVGPILVSKRKIGIDEINNLKIALPGEHTTAHLLFNMAYPLANNKGFYLFSEIEDVVLSDEADVGVLIHESRFTYQQKGLTKVQDLGDFWEHKTGLPVPLGGIAIKRSLPNNIKLELENLLRQSVEFAFSNPESSLPFVRKYAQSMDSEVMQKHIQLYVNNYSVTLGNLGRKAIIEMLNSSTSLAKGLADVPIFLH